MEEIRSIPWNGFTCASTFSGCGGSSTGYRMAGFKVLWASEFIEAARDSYQANAAPYTILDGRDIRQVKPKEILDVLKMKPGGAFFLVEKIIGSSAEIDEQMTRHYYKHKTAHGYSQDQIQRKRLALKGVLVSVTAQWNLELLNLTGFKHVDCFWRWMNFGGYIAIK